MVLSSTLGPDVTQSTEITMVLVIVWLSDINTASGGSSDPGRPYGIWWWHRPRAPTQTLAAVGPGTHTWPLPAVQTQTSHGPRASLGHPCQPVPHHLCISSFPSLHSAQTTPLLLSHFPTTQLFIVALPAWGTGHWAGLGLSSVGLGLDRFFLITPLSNVFSLSAGHSFSFFRASLRELKRVCKVLILIRLNNSACFPRL